MLCDRCIMSVKQIFGEAGFEHADVEMGKVRTDEPPPTKDMDAISISLIKVGFEIISDSKSMLNKELFNPSNI